MSILNSSPSTASAVEEQQRRSQIAAAAYAHGRRAALAAVNHRGLYQRAHTRQQIIRTETYEYRPRSDSRAYGMLDTNRAVARAAAYVAAAHVAHELLPTETLPNDPAAEQWRTETLERTAVHEEAWRERLTNAGIDGFGLHPRLDLSFVDQLPPELESLDYDTIAEHTLDVSSTSADVEPIRLSDLLIESPQPQNVEAIDAVVVDITDHIAEVNTVHSIESGAEAW